MGVPDARRDVRAGPRRDLQADFPADQACLSRVGQASPCPDDRACLYLDDRGEPPACQVHLHLGGQVCLHRDGRVCPRQVDLAEGRDDRVGYRDDPGARRQEAVRPGGAEDANSAVAAAIPAD